MKTIYKPWGREEWLELNNKYCYKRIYINAGHRTSYQYHEYKTETNFIIEGVAEIWLEDDAGVINKNKMSAGDFFTVVPTRKHRVIAITDIILQEVSTPEVDDVIRIEDDAKREDGVIAHEQLHPALCILAAGRGTRLDYLSEITNKGLLPLQNKAVISHIIDKTPNYFDVIIAVGYKADMVKEYCAAAHSDRNIIFVDVENYDGKDSGPGVSFLACVKYLQRPFYLSTADCLVEGPLPSLERNWLGISPTSIPEIYSTVRIEPDYRIKAFSHKSPHGFEHAFIGLCGIRDYKTFIDALTKNILQGELVSAFDDVSIYDDLYAERLSWYDTGTIDGYLKVRELFGNDAGLEKVTTQTFYNINHSVIKTNTDEQLVKDIIERARVLKSYVPPLTYTGKHTYAYDWIDGYTLYEWNVPETYSKFAMWCFANLWAEAEDIDIRSECESFYKDKTYNRLKQFLNSKPDNYIGTWKVNGKECKGIYDCLDHVDWGMLYDAWPTKLFHGDLQFDNVIFLNDHFTLIDWRDSFAGNSVYGDAFYDMAKLYGGMQMSYAAMKDSTNFYITVADDVTYDFYRPDHLDLAQEIFESKLDAKGWLTKIKLMTSLIHLNMAPIHPGAMGDILFFKALKELQYNEDLS